MSKRIIQLIKETGKDISFIKSFAKRLSIVILDEYQKVSDQEFERLKELLEEEVDTIGNKGKGSRELYLTNELPVEFTNDNPFTAFQTDILQNGLRKKQASFIEYNDKKIESVFDDFEAYTICRGLNVSRATKIARDFFRDQNITTRIEAHELAMSALKKYGWKMLSFVVRFPPLPFQSFDVKSLFTELDRKAKDTDLPVIRVAYTNEKGSPEKLELRFYVERDAHKTQVFKNVIEIKNKSTNSIVAQIARNGKIIPSEGSRNIVPIIQLFITNASNIGKLQINYGLDTGECSICGRELTDATSIKRGIGPVCIKNMAC
jgi:hypothetical protein